MRILRLFYNWRATFSNLPSIHRLVSFAFSLCVSPFSFSLCIFFFFLFVFLNSHYIGFVCFPFQCMTCTIRFHLSCKFLSITIIIIIIIVVIGTELLSIQNNRKWLSSLNQCMPPLWLSNRRKKAKLFARKVFLCVDKLYSELR